MDILSQLEDLKANLQTATESKAALETTLAELNAGIAARDEAATAKDKELADLNAVLASKDESLAAIQAKVQELTAAQKTAEEKAIEIVASQGIAPVKVDSKSGNELSGDDARAEYARLQKEDPIKAGKYFAANMGRIFSK